MRVVKHNDYVEVFFFLTLELGISFLTSIQNLTGWMSQQSVKGQFSTLNREAGLEHLHVPANIKYSKISVKTSWLFFQFSAPRESPHHVQNHISLDLLKNAMRESSGYYIGAVLLWLVWLHYGFAYYIVKGY